MFLLRLALLLASSLGVASIPQVALAQQDPFQRLAHPEVAQRLGLSDPQRASIQQLLLERSQLDSLADPTQRKTQLQDNASKLLAILNEDQKRLWSNDGPGKLKFQFRDMEWDAVLDWFARQEALTLVMDRTPPGTFTYSDHREYTSAEAVDLLNSVLLTRGFTLVRREKMLIVFELSDAIPIELIPRISLEDLPARGKFELVSILFPLGTRPIDEVIKEVTPYLGKYGRAIPLAQSRQLLVIENAGKMQTINVLIANVPEPKVPQPKPEPPPPPQPVFASYSIGNLDPDATLKAIKTLVPSEQITVDGKTRILNANVVPTSQAAIEAALAKMVSEQSAAPPQVSRAFPIGTNDAVSLATQIRALAPQATVAGEKGSTQILVSATEADMKRISEAMNSMGITSSATDKSLRSFPLERKPTDAWLTMVKAMIPQASVWLDADKKRISVLANEEDLKLVGRLIPELIAALPSEAIRTLKAYRVTDEQKQRYLALAPNLTDLASMKVIDPNKAGELLVWGLPEEHTLLDQVLSQLSTSDPNAPSELRRYDLSKSELAQLTLLKPEIEKRIAPTQLIMDTSGTGFWAWGNAKQHETLQAALTPLRKNIPTLRAYSANDEQKRRFTLLLPTLTDLASLKVIDASQPGELMLWGTSEELDLASKLLDQLALSNPNGDSELRRYDLSKSELTQLTLLKPEIEKRISPMQLILDTAGNGFWAWGNAKQHEILQASLTPLRKHVPSLQSYKVSDEQKRRFTLLLPTLTDLPSLRVVDAAQPGQLILWASADEHTVVANLLDQLALGDSHSESILQRYEIPKNQLPQFTLLKPEIDKRFAPLQITLDPATGTIWGWGSRELHAKLTDALAPLQQPAGPSKQEVVIAYPLQHADPVTLKPVLAEIHKDVNVVADPKRKMLIVTGNVEQQARLQNAIQQLDQPPTSSSQEEIRAYDLRGLQAAAILPTLQLMWPDLKFTSDPTANKLIASGSSREHQALQKAIDQLLEPADGQTMEVKTYPVPFGEVTTLNAVILQLAPKSVTSPDLINRTITAWATTEQHQRIQQALEQLSQTAQGRQELITYKVTPERTLAIKTSLATLFPTVAIAADVVSGQITVLAAKEVQAKISEVIEKANQPKPADEERIPFRYEVPLSLRSSFAPLLTQAFPAATVVTPSTDLVSPLVVLATHAEHEKIASLVEELRSQVDSATSLNAQYELRIFPIDVSVTDATSVMNALKAAMPTDVLVQANPTTNSVIVSGPLEQLDRAAQLVTSLQARKEFVAYKVPPDRTLAIKTSLATLFPTTSIAADPISGQIMVVASKELQSKIADAIEKSNQPKSPDEERIPIRYEVPPSLRSSFAPLLNQAFPSATVATPPTDLVSPLVVLATQTEHEKIAALAEELRAQVDSATALNAKHELRIFPIDVSVTDATSVMNALKAAMPSDVLVQANATTNSVIVTGPLEQLERASQLVHGLQEAAISTIKSTRVYPLRFADPLAAARVLTPSLPRATVVGDVATKTVAVTGNANEHDRVAEFMKAFDVATSTDRTTQVYRVGLTNATTLASALQLMLPQASVQADATSGAIIVTANPQEHERVKTVVTQLDQRGDSPMITKSYALRHADPTAASRALTTSFPKAIFAPDATNGGLFVTATDSEHTEIDKLVQEMNSQSLRKPTLQSYSLKKTSATVVGTALQKALLRSLTASVSFDDASATIFVVGTPDDQSIAKQLIDTLDAPDAARESRQLKLFSLTGVDGLSATTTIKALFENEKPTIDVRYDSTKGQLVVLGSPTQLEAVEKTLAEFAPPERKLEIISLRANEPAAVRSAIQSLFTDTSYAESPNVNVDEAKQQLIIRATPEQWTQIRILLQQMGEPTTNDSANLTSPTQRVRTLAAPPDAPRVLERIQKIWPSIRPNRLEVFQPNQLEPANIPIQPHGPFQPPQESTQPPVIIIPGEQRWTIASDDPEALAELEKLLASNGIQSASPIISTGNYSLYLLEHAGASTIATLLSDLLNKGSSSTSTSSLLGKVKVVADARINAIIVYGTRTERQVIEQLLGVLDSDAMQDSLQSLLPQIVAIENTNAKRVYDSIREIYKNQLASDGGRRPLPIPEGIAPGVALLMQQINAASTGPLLTVSLDAMTNSLLVRAPRELSSEVVNFIHLMDRQASDKMTTRIDVIPLQHSNVARIRKALDLLILGK